MTRRVQVTGGPDWARGKVGALYGEIHDIGLYDVLVEGRWLVLRGDEFGPVPVPTSSEPGWAVDSSDGNVVVVMRATR